MPAAWTIVGGLVLVALLGGAFLVVVYNRLVDLRENIDKAWSNISVILQQRHDEILKLVDACKGFMRQEEAVLVEVTRLRTQYQEALSRADQAGAENALNASLHGLLLRAEAYPELKSNQNVLQLQERISGLESQIADRREFYNESVRIFNIAIRRFPDLIPARILGYKEEPFLDPPDKVKQDVKVDL